MITEDDLQEAIAECVGTRNPGASTCLKLASFYTIRDHLFPAEREKMSTYSYAAEPKTATYVSETEFGRLIRDKDPAEILAVMDELMTTLQGILPRLYDGVMAKIE